MKMFKWVTKAVVMSLLATGLVQAKESQYEYVVVGAGSAGLSAAYELKRLDKKFIVLEKNERAGGIAENGQKGRFHYAKGTEYLGAPEGHFARVIKDLNISMVEIPSPMDASFFNGKMYIGDNKVASLTIEQTNEEEFQKFIDLLNSVEHMTFDQLRKLDHMTAKQWLDDNNIAMFIQTRYEVMARGLFGANLTDISALSFIPEAYFDYQGVKSITELLEPSVHSGSWSAPKGIASIATTIASHLKSYISYDSAVINIEPYGSNYQLQYKHDGQIYTVISEKVIIATPASVAFHIGQKVLSEKQLKLIKQVKYTQYATVALFSDTPIFDKAFDLAILDGDVVTDLYDATWIERSHTSELAEVDEYIASAYLAPQDVSDHSLLKNSDSQLLEIVFKELSRIDPDIPSKVTGYDIKRFYNAYPVFNTGYFTRLRALKSSFEGIYLAGDYMSYPTFDAAFESGYEAVVQAENHEK